MACRDLATLSLDELLALAPNSKRIDRISFGNAVALGDKKLDLHLNKHVVHSGKPIVIDQITEVTEDAQLSGTWLRTHHGNTIVQVRDSQRDGSLPQELSRYLAHTTAQHETVKANSNARVNPPASVENFDAPVSWIQKIESLLPKTLFCPTAFSASDCLDQGILPDLSAYKPDSQKTPPAHVCIDHKGSDRPPSQSPCASIWFNLMIEDQPKAGSDAQTTLWLIILPQHRRMAEDHCIKKLGSPLVKVMTMLPLDFLAQAPFPVYVHAQHTGELLILPPLATAQVMPRNRSAMSLAWSKHTPETLKLAIEDTLPRHVLSCEASTHQVKAIIHASLFEIFSTINERRAAEQELTTPSHLQSSFIILFKLFKQMLLAEALNPAQPCDVKLLHKASEERVVCSYCTAEIWNRFLSCESCQHEAQAGANPADTFDICLDCYCLGRSCKHISGMIWIAQYEWTALLSQYEAYNKLEAIFTEGCYPQVSFGVSRARLPHKTTAEIAYHQLRIRPLYRGPIAQAPPFTTPVSIADAHPRYATKVCHMCHTKHPSWQTILCTQCDEAWCYQDLYDYYGQLPVDVLKEKTWQCHHCWRLCRSNDCLELDDMEIVPTQSLTSTLRLGSSADTRSVQVLFDAACEQPEVRVPATPQSQPSHNEVMPSSQQPSDPSVADLSFDRHDRQKRRKLCSSNDDDDYIPTPSVEQDDRPIENTYLLIKSEDCAATDSTISAASKSSKYTFLPALSIQDDDDFPESAVRAISPSIRDGRLGLSRKRQAPRTLDGWLFTEWESNDTRHHAAVAPALAHREDHVQQRNTATPRATVQRCEELRAGNRSVATREHSVQLPEATQGLVDARGSIRELPPLAVNAQSHPSKVPELSAKHPLGRLSQELENLDLFTKKSTEEARKTNRKVRDGNTGKCESTANSVEFRPVLREITSNVGQQLKWKPPRTRRDYQ